MSKRSNNGNRSFTKLLLVLALVAAACTDAAETTTTSAEPEATTTVAEGEPEESTTTAEGEPEESTTTTEAPAGESDGILRVWSAQETELIFHPVQACCGQEKIHGLIFNELLGKDQDSITLRPELAVDWEPKRRLMQLSLRSPWQITSNGMMEHRSRLETSPGLRLGQWRILKPLARLHRFGRQLKVPMPLQMDRQRLCLA